ncbi:MAG: restriction endonuclease subunit S [Ruminiclostridium sp.]
MTPQELKNSILQLAIQGKLVQQRPEEGTGEELYKQIQAEKQKLIKEGKIKKAKPLPEITEHEIPFDIPESWKWVRFFDVFDVRDGTHDTPKYVLEGIPLVTSKNLVDGSIDFETTKLISCEDAEAINMRSAVDDGDILFAMIGTIGNPVLVHKDREFCVKNMALFKAINQCLFDMEYFLLFLQNEQYAMKKKASGGVQAFVSLKFLRNYLLPLPPLAEQKRIVAKIEELLPYIDRYEKAWSKLEDFNKRFPVDMQKSILQMAIQGKLVEQRPEEGTGEELYEQIQAEKQKLIKEGKIKKEKPLPEISEDEIPFDIPESWKWVRMGDLAQLVTKGSSPRWQGIQYVEQGLLFVTSENIGVSSLLWENKKYVEKRFNELSPRSQLAKGDLLTNIVGASIGRTAVFDLDEPANINQAVCLIRLVNSDLLQYILMYMNSATAYNIMMSDKVDTARANISLTNISNFIIPLPPLAEQKRIVAKLEEILPLCERLK